MGGSREAMVYSNPGHRFDGLPMGAFDKISSLSGFQYYANDFIVWEGPTGDAAAPGTGGWICTSVDAGADTAESVDVLDTVEYGILRINSNNADNDNTQLQMNGASFFYVVGKRLWFEIRIALEDVNDGEVLFGMILESDVDAINTLPAHGIFFEKNETAVDFDFHVRQGGTSTEDTLFSGATLADDTFFTMGFVIDVVGNITPYYNGTAGTAVAVGNANIPNAAGEDMTVAIQVQTGTTATRYVDVDYLLAAQER